MIRRADMKTMKWLPLVCALLVTPEIAPAADNVAAVRAELQAMKSEYDARVSALEEKIKQLEVANAAAADASAALAASPPPPEPAAAPAPASGGGSNAFNPSISVILGGT